MTHEFKDIVFQAKANQQLGLKNVLASVVFLEGSSYRKPGVRMLISENGTMTGAVSGGCVESEVLRRAQSVFQDNKAKIMTYDGRYRLGCEGLLYILLEPFVVSDDFIEAFQELLERRDSFTMESYYQQKDDSIGAFGTVVHIMDAHFKFYEDFKPNDSSKLQVFSQTLQPRLKLLIIGAEHDAVKLCLMASLLGWEVDVISSHKDPKLLSDFPGANSLRAEAPETIDLQIDIETAVVLMTHNYAQDLKYLLKFETLESKYMGILGSIQRREQLQNDLIQYAPDISESFLERLYSPAGLHIGAITPEEIALSILSEILSVIRKTESESLSLRNMSGKIHN